MTHPVFHCFFPAAANLIPAANDTIITGIHVQNSVFTFSVMQAEIFSFYARIFALLKALEAQAESACYFMGIGNIQDAHFNITHTHLPFHHPLYLMSLIAEASQMGSHAHLGCYERLNNHVARTITPEDFQFVIEFIQKFQVSNETKYVNNHLVQRCSVAFTDFYQHPETVMIDTPYTLMYSAYILGLFGVGFLAICLLQRGLNQLAETPTQRTNSKPKQS